MSTPELGIVEALRRLLLTHGCSRWRGCRDCIDARAAGKAYAEAQALRAQPAPEPALGICGEPACPNERHARTEECHDWTPVATLNFTAPGGTQATELGTCRAHGGKHALTTECRSWVWFAGPPTQAPGAAPEKQRESEMDPSGPPEAHRP